MTTVILAVVLIAGGLTICAAVADHAPDAVAEWIERGGRNK